MILLLDVPRSYIVRSSLRRMLTHCHMGLWLRMSAIIVVVGVVGDGEFPGDDDVVRRRRLGSPGPWVSNGHTLSALLATLGLSQGMRT